MRKWFLRREMRGWVERGLIDTDRADRILARYGTSLEAQEGSFYRLLSGLAVLLVGLALLLLVSAHWQQLPRLVRLLGLVLVTLGLNLYGLRRLLAGRGGAMAALSLGGLAYGASIMLIGQMYHLGEHYSAGFLLWALGVMPMALLTGGVALAVQALLAASLWAWRLAPFAPPWAMPLFLIPVLLVARRRRSPLLFLAAFLATGLWLNEMLSWAYATDFGPRWRMGLYPFDLALLLLALTISRSLLAGTAGGLLQTLLARLTLLVAFPLTFVDAWDSYMRHNWGWLDPGLWATLLVLLPVLVIGPGRRRGLAAGLMLVMVAVHGWGAPEQSVVAAALSNLLVLAIALFWLRSGLVEGEAGLFFTGLGGILLLALLRYLDLIGGYLGGVVLFLVMAAVIWGAARYWRGREAGT